MAERSLVATTAKRGAKRRAAAPAARSASSAPPSSAPPKNSLMRRALAPAVLAVAAVLVGLRRGAATAPRNALAYGGKPCENSHCKPSFLIIGIGKCGTSSLYYYLVGHPSVRPASQKQLQWFDHAYDRNSFATRYLAHFPKTLKPGEISGEASPGYAQYSNVPRRVYAHLAGVRVLCIARDPAERAYSSYYYNYVTSAGANALPFGLLVDAEVALLEKFFRDDKGTPGKDGRKLHDLSANCYGGTTAEHQVGAAARAYAKTAASGFSAARSMPRANQHLWRQLVGRSLYAANLEWWYAVHDAADILLICSEDLGDAGRAAAEMSRVAGHLGLDAFDFGPVVGKGKYNAGAQHRGYGAVTPWADAAARSARKPMDPAARHAVANFTAPFNARLFDLAGHACAEWGRAPGGEGRG